jgi:hypothetical protein
MAECVGKLPSMMAHIMCPRVDGASFKHCLLLVLFCVAYTLLIMRALQLAFKIAHTILQSSTSAEVQIRTVPQAR